MYAYGRGLEIVSHGEEAGVPSARDHLSGDMLLSPEGSREIYHIHSNGTRYFIPTLQTFNSRRFSLDDIIPNIPMDVIKAFPFGPGGAHPLADGTAVQFHKNRIVYYVMGGVLHPIGSNRVFERLNLKYDEIVKDNAHTGNVFSTLPFGPTITE